MTTMRKSLFGLRLLVVGLLLSGAGVAGAAPVLPNFDAATFIPDAPIDNPFFPLVPGTLYTYEGQRQQDSETVTETDTVLVSFQTRTILGIPARVVVDDVRDDGVLTEHTLDFFAQDTAGNVWYLGEESTEFLFDDEGNPIGTSTEGSWQAGVNGARPGFAMEAAPAVGDQYFQEFSPGVAEDQAEVVSLDGDVTVPAGHFTNALVTFETTPLDPEDLAFKFYARGIGQVLELEVNENLEPTFASELVSVTMVIPEPMSLTLAVLGLGGLAWMRRRLA
jgi:hypothetical protein